jgi:hypothetical protein
MGLMQSNMGIFGFLCTRNGVERMKKAHLKKREITVINVLCVGNLDTTKVIAPRTTQE